MPEELIIILCIIAGIYLLTLLIIGMVIHSLKKDIIRKEKAINVIMAEKYDLIISLGNLMIQHGIDVPTSISNTLNLKKHENLKVYNTIERLSIKTLLMKTVDMMFFISEEQGLYQNERYRVLKSAIEDIDIHHRKDIARYNSQVVAYNYWIKCWVFKPISYVFKLKEKEIFY